MAKERNNLLDEAVKLNGRYLEDMIDGYTTLGSSGRRSLEKSLETVTVGATDGDVIKRGRYPSREITIYYVIQSDSEDELILAVNQLNNILNQSECDFVFNDEPDKYFSGTAVMDSEPKKYRKAVKGSFSIHCSYPFKRTTQVVTHSSNDADVTVTDTSATFTINYNGTQPSRPVLKAKFASRKSEGDFSEDGDCGFVAFIDADENIIQLGNPEAVDLDEINKNATLINSSFDALTNWTADGMSVSPITDQYWNNGAGYTYNYASGTGSLTRSTEGAVNFEFDMVHRFAVLNSSEAGSLECFLQNEGSVVVGFSIVKEGNGTTGTVRYIIDDKVVGTDQIDLSYYNTSFGYCKKDAVYVQETYYEEDVPRWYAKHASYWEWKYRHAPWKKRHWKMVEKVRTVQDGWSYTQSNLNSGITKDGAVVTFSIGRLGDRTFKRTAVANTPCTDVAIRTTGNINTNALRSVAYIRKAGVAFADIPNVFTADDVVEADCNSASVYLYRNNSSEGHLEPQYGALGNDWETFQLKTGTNIIRAVWSDWVNPTYKPTIEISYNEVYL